MEEVNEYLEKVENTVYYHVEPSVEYDSVTYLLRTGSEVVRDDDGNLSLDERSLIENIYLDSEDEVRREVAFFKESCSGEFVPLTERDRQYSPDEKKLEKELNSAKRKMGGKPKAP
jgi:hypothetical protein